MFIHLLGCSSSEIRKASILGEYKFVILVQLKILKFGLKLIFIK